MSLPPPRSLPPGRDTSALALGKTMFGAPASPRLPTEIEARANPNLVVSLDVSPPARPEVAQLAQVDSGTATSAAKRLPPDTARVDTPVDLPFLDPPTASNAGRVFSPPDKAPVELLLADRPKRSASPPPEPASSGEGERPRSENFAKKLLADAKSAVDLLGWALDTYLKRPKPFFVLAALLVLPASVLQSCVLTSLSRDSRLYSPGGTTVDFSPRKAELANRIQTSQARGALDTQAVTELAALTASETAHVMPAGGPVSESTGWLREKLSLLVQGLLLFGLAFPVACAALAVATTDLQSGGALPAFADVWPLLLARGKFFLASLMPAALVVAVGNALFVLPGLIASVLFLFVPHAVLFEKKSGWPALSRSIELVRDDATRAVLAFVAFAVAGFAAAMLTGLLLPPWGSRLTVFMHYAVGDVLEVAVLPVPALALARMYMDLRRRSGADAERLARAARG